MNVLENYFDTGKIPDYCSKEKLNKFYNAYLYNLHQSAYRTSWVALDEIEERLPKVWKCIGDKYLENSETDTDKLAMDIYSNGTYFPVFVMKLQGEKYKIRDGIHRVFVMRKLVEKGYWNEDHKILICTNEHVDSGNKERRFHIPMAVVDEFKENYRAIYDDMKEGLVKYIDQEKELAEYKTIKEGYLEFTCLSLLLRNAFFEYREKNGIAFKPSPVINNEEAWKKWRGF